MKRAIGLVAVAIVVLALLPLLASPGGVGAEPPPTEEWVARYDGPAHDNAHGIALDDAGNVYVTGYSQGIGTDWDYATIKYDTDGNELWVARYDGPASGDDETAWIALDNAGNVYVAGMSEGIGTSEDYATIKYDTDGNELWVARYDGPASGWDDAMGIAVDSVGNVCVTGASKGIGTDYDYATIKYDTDGNELWVARYDGPASGNDQAFDIAVDGLGNVYVTGGSQSIGTDYYDDYATIKYDTDGNELWVARYDGPASSYDYALGIAVDSAGNVYVTGDSGNDYATIKYDPDGNELWVARYDGPASSSDRAIDIGIDDAGNVYVTGHSQGIGTEEDYATIKYDTDGNELWVARYDGPASGSDWVTALAVDDLGNIYVTGGSAGSHVYDYHYATIKYDTDGDELWVARHYGTRNGWYYAEDIVVDGVGAVYVTGLGGDDETNVDYVTMKYSYARPVGGTIVPTDKLGLVMPWIMAAALIVVAGMSLAVWNKRRGGQRASG